MYSDQLSNVLRTDVQPLLKFRQFCDAKDATPEGYGKELHTGQLFSWNVYEDVANQGGTLVETTTMPETNFTIVQGTLTITEYGNSVPYTGKLDDLSYQPVKDIVKNALTNDAVKAFDIAAWDEFDKTALRAVGTETAQVNIELTTDGTATATNRTALTTGYIKTIVDTMKERNIPGYMNDDYIALSHVSTFRVFANELESVHQHTETGYTRIVNGLRGRYEGTLFVEQTHIPKGGAADSTTFSPLTGTADAWGAALSSWVVFIGGDTVAEAMVIPEEIRGKLPGDYGRSKGIAWYYLGGFGLVHTAAMFGARNSRIVKWDSGV